MKYYLIGKTLKHSYSTSIHKYFKNDNYSLKELDENQLSLFLRQKDFDGLNVTIPYKNKVIEYLDKLDDISKQVQSVNTIINDNGFLKGYNTDYYGFNNLLDYYNVDVYNKNVLILGSGSSSNMIKFALNQKKANKIYIVSRTKNLTYDKLDNIKKEIDIIINTTPYNMYPNNNNDLLFLLDGYDKLSVVIDIIYNPYNTNLLIEAKKKNIKAISGFYMLICQAYYSELLFNNKNININDINEVYKKVILDNLNIVFIGMPFVGKTTLANQLAKLLNKKVIDTDLLIEDKIKMSIKDYININGENKFRLIEKEVIKSLKNIKGCIISTGGGVILDEYNMFILKENGIVIFIDRNIKNINIDDSRPLIKNKQDLLNTYNYRYPIYLKYQDYIITDDNINDIINNVIKEKKV